MSDADERAGRTGVPTSTNVEDSDAARGRPALRSFVSLANVLLVAAGLSLFVIYRFAQQLAPGTETIREFVCLALLQCAIYAAASLVAWRARPTRATLVLVLAFAALFRLALLFEPPRLSDDVYRYVWDGRVQAAGVNPYRYVPADPALAHLRDAAIYEHINRRDYAPTIYPPAAQVVFFAATRVAESVTWMKCVMVAFEAAALWAVAALLASFGLPRQRVVLAAWHPLMVWEIAGSGHLDAILICFVASALLARRRGRDALTGFFLACAALTKLFPVVLAPALYRRWSWRTPAALVATVAAAYLPYLSVGLRRAVGYLPGYAQEEGLENGARFYLLSLARRATALEIPNAAFVLSALVALLALALWSLRARGDGERGLSEGGPAGRGFAERAFVLAGAFTALLSPRYSWYFVWLVPFLCVVRASLVVPVLYMTAASFVLYLSWAGDDAARMFALHSIIYLPAAVLCVVTWLTHRRRRAEAAASQPARDAAD